jgi:hypothetical protein
VFGFSRWKRCIYRLRSSVERDLTRLSRGDFDLPHPYLQAEIIRLESCMEGCVEAARMRGVQGGLQPGLNRDARLLQRVSWLTRDV